MSAKQGPPIKRKSVPLIAKSADSFQIGALPSSLSESLTNGTSIPAPPPPTLPPKDDGIMAPPPPIVDKNNNAEGPEYTPSFSSTSSPPMPGTFPIDENQENTAIPQTPPKLKKMGYQASASASPSPYASPSQPSSSSKSPRRPSSVFRLLNLKRSFNDRASSSSESFSTGRPQTPGAESMLGSLADSGTGGSLRKKKSGSFWGRRKSSLSHVTGADEMGQSNGHGPTKQREISSSSGYGSGKAAIDEDEEFPPRLKKKKSLTFWRRSSSLGLDRVMQDNIQRQNGIEGISKSNGRDASIDVEMGGVVADLVPVRPRSPPPQLPEVGGVLHEEGGLMGEEDWFGNIH